MTEKDNVLTSKNCSNCINHTDGFCAVNPVHYSVWEQNKSLDDFTKKSIKVGEKNLDECNNFELQNFAITNNMSQVKVKTIPNNFDGKFGKLTKGKFFAGFLLFAGLAGSTIFSYVQTAKLPPYRNNSFPYHLSDETRLAIPKCLAIHNSLESELTYKGKFRKISQLDTCLGKTPFYPFYQKDVRQISNYLHLAAYQPSSLDVQKLNTEYEILIQKLGDFTLGIPALEYYRVRFAFMFILQTLMVFTLYILANILLTLMYIIHFDR